MSAGFFKRKFTPILLSAALFGGAAATQVQAGQLLATVGDFRITSEQLEAAVQSSPFATQFNTMDQEQQAGLRGNLLQRLVASRLFILEARRLGLDQEAGYRQAVAEQRLGLLYRAYMDRLRERIEIPAETLAEMKGQLKGEPDALAAAKSAWRAERYEVTKAVALAHLADKYRLVYHEERIGPRLAADVVVAEGDGFRITAGECAFDEEEIDLRRDKVRERAELELVARAAEAEGIDVSDRLAAFEEERLPALLLERKRAEWAGDEQQLRDYFDAHPELSLIPERRHVGQLVVAERAEAEALRERILKGESLFTLAGEYSIDPYGRSRNGDMGWLRAGTGMPEIEAVLKQLEDGQVSEVIETHKGFHLVTVLARKLGKQMYFDAIRDRVERELLAERFTPYVNELQARHPVTWNVTHQ